ncbi:glutathione S-transferase [Spathaspora passalidarum NRRL Y-27907]|uniref:Glutathione S-transferase n=1 Tax=Spathaspora passalidarum (strain NRRL Y-27907 / 11-Y1) TaxID=619300 RepID=G3AGR0_SPAPN|nr:glutathione S-transferase [Spathaspora passalidarum NRRL Y-27907]EGW35393.1 glutathione S-transferase [Spathaspora passalidarum NRRL Y-27907]
MSHALKLYSFPTPNGVKVSIFLELLGLKYDAQAVDIRTNEQKQDWFVKLNPNGRIPTLVDSSTGVTISQTGAILQYLADTYDKEHKWSYPQGTPEYYKQLEYLIFQVAENGPIQGQANHFVVFAQEKIPYAINRYLTDVKRIYGVYEDILGRNDKGLYLVGDHYSIADIALFGWANSLSKLDIDIHTWPKLGKWFDALSEIPGVQKGLKVPTL